MAKKSKTAKRTAKRKIEYIKNLGEHASQFARKQPDPKLKSQGWERRREAQKLMDKLLSLSDMTMEEFQNIQEDVKKNPSKYTVIEVKLAQYLSDKRNTIDFLDRHISKAPVQQELTGKDGEDLKAPVIIISGDIKD